MLYVVVIVLLALLVWSGGNNLLQYRQNQQLKDHNKILEKETEDMYLKYMDTHLESHAAYAELSFKSAREKVALRHQLDDAYSALELALAAAPGQFDDVAVELGLLGVVYQFHKKALEETHAGSSHHE